MNVLSSRGGLDVECLLYKLHDSVLVDQSPLGACMINGTNGQEKIQVKDLFLGLHNGVEYG